MVVLRIKEYIYIIFNLKDNKMVVLRIKEYENGEVCLEYRMTRKERSMTISDKEINMSSYHYFKLGTFGEKCGAIIGVSDPRDSGKSFYLMKALSEMGENSITDFVIEIAANPNEIFRDLDRKRNKTIPFNSRRCIISKT